MNTASTEARSIKMETMTTRLVAAGVLFLITVLSGVWLSNSGRPLNSAIFTVHKLIAVATIVVIGISVYNLYRSLDLRTFIELTVIAATALLFLALTVTGGMLSLKELLPGPVLPAAALRVHQVAPLLALVASAATVYLLAGAKS